MKIVYLFAGFFVFFLVDAVWRYGIECSLSSVLMGGCVLCEKNGVSLHGVIAQVFYFGVFAPPGIDNQCG
jgi:hypothetical protein